MTEQKKRFWTLTGIAALLTALATVVAALANVTKNKINENELLTKSVYEIVTEQIPEMRERIAVLEATCKPAHIASMHGCSSDLDCGEGMQCVNSSCVKAKTIAKETLPSFEKLQQHVQKTGKSWERIKGE